MCRLKLFPVDQVDVKTCEYKFNHLTYFNQFKFKQNFQM